MSIVETVRLGKGTSAETGSGSADSRGMSSLIVLVEQVEKLVQDSASGGRSFHDFELDLHEMVQRIGNMATRQFIALQGDGDLGESVTTDEGVVLHRSVEPVVRPFQTVFGQFDIRAFVYSRGEKRRIELRPVDARMQLPGGHASFLFEEFAQYFCVEQAFDRSAEAIQRILRQTISKETLERMNQRVGLQAEEYLDSLVAPPAADEGDLLIVTGDGKGVPLVKADLALVPIFDPDERRGNRRMATLGCVYSVDRFVRTSDEILAGLFREKNERVDERSRPKPIAKQLVARFSRERDLGDGVESISGQVEAFVWTSERVRDRLKPGQPLIVLLDGAPSQWDTIHDCLDSEVSERAVEILDLIHVSQYIWRAAKVFHPHREHQEAFARERLDRILHGDAASVITGIRSMATRRRLKGLSLTEITKVCGYLENNKHRMKYNEYLAAGYPIATGVIEGACRHLVKDRMERSGMRWTIKGAQPMLNIRAIHQSQDRSNFYQTRIQKELDALYPHKSLILNYQPCQA